MEYAENSNREVLEELRLMEARLTEKFVGRCDSAERRVEERCDSIQAHFTARCDTIQEQVDVAALRGEERLIALEEMRNDIEHWRPDLVKRIEDVALEVARVNKFLERERRAEPFDKPGIFGSYTAAPPRPPAGPPPSAGPYGHRYDQSHRERESGYEFTPTRGPVKGTHPPHPTRMSGFMPEQFDPYETAREPGRSAGGRLPHISFPRFDGSHPQLWRVQSENYFEMYDTEYHMWVKVASMHFEGKAYRWLQSVERRLRHMAWEEFCSLIHERFGREQHESLIRQLFHIRQNGSVSEYVEQFAALADELAAYESRTDPLYYTMRFIDGLKHDIKSVIMVQRPTSLDSACALALVQEEALDSTRRRRGEPISHRMAYPHVAAGPDHGRTDGALSGADRTSTDHRRLGSADRLASLRSYRRACGLCDRCAEKWMPGHKCPTTVQLQVIEEVWDMLNELEAEETVVEPTEQVMMALSAAAWTGSDTSSTLCLAGSIQQQHLMVLVDSGSSHTFITDRLVPLLKGIQPLDRCLHVRVANGQIISCSQQLRQAEWLLSGYKFQTDMIFLPLSSVDLVLGMDWLQKYSPMHVDWCNKWLCIPYNGESVCLSGAASSFPFGALVELRMLSEEHISDAAGDSGNHNLDPRVQSVLDQFSEVFAELVGLPPSRPCDHAIPLIPGANPFTVRPYRYPPALKDEIENQVHHMLSQGVIQKSHSPFASPVLLVKKKDRTWRFCVDYRYLNAITIKSKYPVPVFDQLMDELAQAKWFSKLDLKAGYHQIRLLPGEEPKTAFQTHMGHFEFRVMAFGLTGAPNTFLGAMNETLAPVLCKCALVFFDDILIYSTSFEDHLNHLSTVLQLLQTDQWKVNLVKCAFAQTSIFYLGHVISADGVATDPSKILVIQQWPTPVNVKELRSFLGLAGFYRKFVHHFGLISRPLTELLKKNILFVWTPDHQQAFETLKHALISAPVLALPDFSQPFCIYTDACKTGVGAVLMQNGHPLAFLSKALGIKNQGLSTYEKEYLVIIIAVTQWRTYLQLAEFHIYTDHQSLTQLNEQRLHTVWQQKLYTKLAGLQYRIIYKKGADNLAADALSRYPGSGQLSHISQCTPTWIEEVIQGYPKDEHAQRLLTQLALTTNTATSAFTLRDGIIRYKNRVWLGNNVALQTKVLAALHDSPLGGHSGFPVTYRRVKQLFYWKGMKQDILQYVQSCDICQ
jgi:hypothetical protein